MYVEKVSPFNAPNFDLFAPARRSDDRGVVLGTQLDGGQAYVPWIGLSTIRELALKHADKVGLVPATDLELAERRIAGLESLLAQANARIDVLEATQDRIAGLAKDGFTVQKKIGRPKKEDS